MRPALLLTGIVMMLVVIKFFEVDPDALKHEAFWAMMTMWATIGVGFIAYHEINESRQANLRQIEWTRQENIKERTLNMCLMYDHDPVIVEVSKALSVTKRKSGEIAKTAGTLRSEFVRLFNYYEVIAIGIGQGVYDEAIVKAHMQDLLWQDTQFFLQPDLLSKFGDDMRRSHFQPVIELVEKWGSVAYD